MSFLYNFNVYTFGSCDFVFSNVIHRWGFSNEKFLYVLLSAAAMSIFGFENAESRKVFIGDWFLLANIALWSDLS